jgi:uncharacterized membrane protein YphA (DoxX/SURF4 family)
MCVSKSGGGFHKSCKSWGLLALRLVVGFIFVYQGTQKLGLNHAGAAMMFDKMVGLPGSGSFWAYFVGTLEVVGGLMVVLGAYVRYAATWLSIIMLVAMATVHRSGPLTGNFLPLSLLGSCLAILGTGAGKLRLVKTECCCKECKNMAADQGGCCGGGKCGGEKVEIKK